MAYCSKNHLFDFELHDTLVKRIALAGGDCTCELYALNIHKGAEQNKRSTDMCIDGAKVLLKNARLVSVMVPDEDTAKRTEDSCTYTSCRPLSREEISVLKGKLSHCWLWINGIDEISKQGPWVYEVECSAYQTGSSAAEYDYLLLRLAFDEVTICWEDYRFAAWYEKIKQYDTSLRVVTNGGEELLTVHVTANDENEDHPHRTLGVTLPSGELYGNGQNMAEALLEIIQRLPEDWQVKSCFTCRHGQFCPYGNADNEIFCMRGLDPQTIPQLCDWMVDFEEMDKRSRTVFSLCEEYQPME